MAATVIRAAEAPRFDVHGAQVVGYASPARGSASLATWRLLLSPEVASPLHQLSVDETFIVLRGAADYEVDGSVFRVGAGDGITVQANTSFRIRAAGDEPFEAIAVVPLGRDGCEARVEGGPPFAPPWTA
jgi:mannose-6-phosphate isomerase-like protein (cupin superfamily)